MITEKTIRQELKDLEEYPEKYSVPEDALLSPAAKEYLNQLQIKTVFLKNRKTAGEKKISSKQTKGSGFRFIDYETGEGYIEKPEYMTHLYGNVLVDKNHPRIMYRGKLDRLQADIVYVQTVIAEADDKDGLLEDLTDILRVLREIMRCEVLNEPFINKTIIGFNHEELRDRSHHPNKYFGVEFMKLPEYGMGKSYALLNLIRAEIRELEVVAVDTFMNGKKMERQDIVEELNRMSSALHIMMCKYLSGEYNKGN